MKSYCFGVDVGGTTIKMGLFSTTGEVLDKWEIPTRKMNNGELVLPDIADAIDAKLAEKNIFKEIEMLKEENKIIKETNNQLLSRMSVIEKQCEMLSKDNERLKNEYKKSNIVLTEMKSSMKCIHSEISKIKKIENSNDFIATIVNDSSKRVNDESSSSDNVSLAENINITEAQKNLTSMSSNITKPSSKLQLNLKNVTDFNEEFLVNYNQFSPSWRKEADKMLMRRKANS